MNLLASVANTAWLASGLLAWGRFRRALNRPRETQLAHLSGLISANVSCTFGRAHGFERIANYADFARRVPLLGSEELSAWVLRIQKGETNTLTHERVTRLLPTSGTTSARKLIPFTAGLQKEFNAAIGPWMIDLARQHPGLIGGPAYWSVTPLVHQEEGNDLSIPIGFEDDSAYLGGLRGGLVEAAMAAPGTLRHVRDIELFRRLALLYLLRCEDLRLISVWHPSFLTLLFDAMKTNWESLLVDIERGNFQETNSLPTSVQTGALRLAPQPKRAARLRTIGPDRPQAIWPSLRLVSCWGDGHARFALSELEQRLSPICIQPKGLLSTEAFVSIPFAGHFPVALTSHFFEFIDEQGRILLLSELRSGKQYEVVVTTRGGLWRYRTGDRIEVIGFLRQTPSIRFLGRAGCISDRFGEKLSEVFIAQCLDQLFPRQEFRPQFAMLAPEEKTYQIWHYTLFTDFTVTTEAAERLEILLRANPHYAYCRDLGQLAPLRIFTIETDALKTYLKAESERGLRLGNIKPVALSLRTDWAHHFFWFTLVLTDACDSITPETALL